MMALPLKTKAPMLVPNNMGIKDDETKKYTDSLNDALIAASRDLLDDLQNIIGQLPGASDGSMFTNLAGIPAGAGVIPAANLPAVAAPDMSAAVNTLATGHGGTGSTANANAANGVVVLGSNGRMPALDARNLTTLVIENRTSDPSSPVSGQIWLRTDL